MLRTDVAHLTSEYNAVVEVYYSLSTDRHIKDELYWALEEDIEDINNYLNEVIVDK